MRPTHPLRNGNALHLLAAGVQAGLFLLVVVGVLIRVVGLLLYVPDSGDEWGNTVAPFRVLFDRGNPDTFFHPALYYYVTAAAYVGIFSFVKVAGVVDGALSMTDLFVLDERYFVFAARGVSVVAAALTFWAVYALARSLWRRQEGLLAAAVLAVLPAHVLYAKTVRVDTLFLLLFVVAFTSIVHLSRNARPASYVKAGLLTGLATAANYNGAILAVWLVIAHFLRTSEGGTSREAKRPQVGTRELIMGLSLAAVAFFAANPFVVLNLETFLRNVAFISGLSVAEHPGWEGRDFLFYVRELTQTNPYLFALIVSSSLAIAVFGNRTERFVLSFPVSYLLLFSLLASKDGRFILPAMPFFLVVASSLPFCLARRFHSRRAHSFLVYALAWALYLPCLATMARQSMPIQPHELLSRPDVPLFEWIESNVPRRSRIAVESGIVNLLDSVKEEGRFAAELRNSIVRTRPGLDHDFIGLVYVGGLTYDPAMLANGEIDFAIVSKRHLPYIEARCAEFPEVCEFHRKLRQDGRVVFETPKGYEPTIVYEVIQAERAES